MKAILLASALALSASVVMGGSPPSSCCDYTYYCGSPEECSAHCDDVSDPNSFGCEGSFFEHAACDESEGCVTEEPVCCDGLRPGRCVFEDSTPAFVSEASPSCQVPCLSNADCVDGWCDVWGEICWDISPEVARESNPGICFDTVHPAKCAMLGGYATQGSSCDIYSGNCADPNDPPVCCTFPDVSNAGPAACENMSRYVCIEYYGGEPVENAVCGDSGCEPRPSESPFCCDCTGIGPFPNVCFEALGPEACLDAGCNPVPGGVCDPVTEVCQVAQTVTPTPTDTVPLPTSTSTKTPTITKTPSPSPTATPAAVCGNASLEPGEQCDPGDPVAGDCCTDDCQFESAETACDGDGESCTHDQCNAEGVCAVGISAPDGTDCDDSDACTENDVCTGGVCGGTALDCDDGYDCTNDSCNPAIGCVNIATIESRDCPGSCFDGINNDPLDPNDPLHDPNNPDNDHDIDFEDSGCASLAPFARFGVIGTRDRMHRDLKLGSNSTIGSTRANGTCDTGTNQCVCPVVECEPAILCTSNADCSSGSCNTATNKCECTLDCPVAGNPCLGDSACLFEVDGTCNGGSGLCECPDYAPNCQPLNRPCTSDDGCGAAPYPSGASFGGVCGNGMQITAGTHMGLLASATQIRKIMFGTAESGDGLRTLDIEREFANAGGPRQLSNPAPFVGPTVCSDAPSQACRVDSDCALGTCSERRRLGDGSPFETFDGVPGAGLAGAGTSENFKRCDYSLSLLRSGGNNNPSVLQAAIEAYAPSPAEEVLLGPSNCLLCPSVDSPDGACSPCANGLINVRTRANTKKVVLTVGNGLQVVDLRRLTLAGKTALVIRGEDDTELMFRVDRALRNGTGAKMFLEGMTSDQVLFVATGRFGGRPRVSGASTWRGSILATERRSGIMLGAQSYMEGGIYGQRILVKGPNSTVQHMPWKGKLANVP